jgi:hypothetical protein
MEGRRSNSDAGALIDRLAQGGAPSLDSLEGPWIALPENTVAFAYAWSLAVVEAIIAQGGMTDISRLLDHIATSEPAEAALSDVLHSSYADLEQQTIAYLKREYLR